MTKVCIVGAPGSGKTTLAAMLYLQCLLTGQRAARLVLEEAPRFIGQYGKLDCFRDQVRCWRQQRINCDLEEAGKFDPIILDGALWLSAVYVKYNLGLEVPMGAYQAGYPYVGASACQRHIEESEGYLGEYDLTIYCPPAFEVEVGAHRIHDTAAAGEIDKLIKESLQHVGGKLVVAPLFAARQAWVEDIALKLAGGMEKWS